MAAVAISHFLNETIIPKRNIKSINTSFDAKSLEDVQFWNFVDNFPTSGVKSSKLPLRGVNRHFPAKPAKNYVRYNFEAANRISTKLEQLIWVVIQSLWVVHSFRLYALAGRTSRYHKYQYNLVSQ